MARRPLTLRNPERDPLDFSVAVTPEVAGQLEIDAPVGIGVSGGKDSSAVAVATARYLDWKGHKGPRLLIHADLGVTEWADSLPACRRLAEFLKMELVVVRRSQGDMMERWEQRWRDNVARWLALSCVKLILPWSTPDMRFCTSEMKVDQITRYLSKRFPKRAILNVTGIRRAESTDRQNALVSKVCKKLESKTRQTWGLDWNPIVEWHTPQVYAYAEREGYGLHEAYTKYGARRVSCVYCILASESDHQIASLPVENRAVAYRMVDLEIASSFAFQGNRWLGDTLNGLLSPEQRAGLIEAKNRGERREFAEGKIPDHLLYVKGWPTCVPTRDEATLLAAVRFAVADAVRLEPTFCNPDQIIARYRELIALKESKK